MTRSLRSDHRNIYILRRNDAAEMNIEAVCEHQHIAFLKVRLNIILVKCCLLLIVDQNHDDICLLCSFCCCIYLKTLCLSLCPGFTSLVQTDDYIATRLF